MDDKKNFINLFKPILIPISLSLGVIVVILSFISFEKQISWKMISCVVLIVSLTWALWYRFSKIEEKPLIDGEKRKVLRHRNKFWRWAVFILPILSLVSLIFLPVNFEENEFDYSDLLQGGGPYTPVVVFDSEPRGASVRVAKIYYADEDPYLLDEKNDNIYRLTEKTLTRARLSQGQYWVVFEYEGQMIQRALSLVKPEVVKVDFK